MKIILPAAGYGTRMYPLTKDIPKTLLELQGKTILDRLIEQIAWFDDLTGIIIITNNRFYKLFEKWLSSCKYKDMIHIINDGTKNNEERIGTVGDILLAIETEKIEEDIMLINPDTVLSFNLNKFKEFFDKKKSGVIGLFDVKKLEIANKKGKTMLDEKGRVVLFKEKDETINLTLCSVAGLCLLKGHELKFINQYVSEGNSLDVSGKFIEWLYTRDTIYGYVFDNKTNYYFDIGSLESYEDAKKFASKLR